MLSEEVNCQRSATRKFLLARENEDYVGPYGSCFSCQARARFLVVCLLRWRGYFRTGEFDVVPGPRILEEVVGTIFSGKTTLPE